MKPIRRELLNGLFVLVVASLLSVAFTAFQVAFDKQLWVLILIGLGITVTGYVVFEVALGYMASTEKRETEWLRRVGTPARLELNEQDVDAAMNGVINDVKSIRPGSDLTTMFYVSSDGGSPFC
jgi:hypothetical protein